MRTIRQFAAAIPIAITILLPLMGVAFLLMMTQVIGWIATGVIVAIAFTCPWLAYGFMPDHAVRRDIKMRLERRSRQVLVNAARMRR